MTADTSYLDAESDLIGRLLANIPTGYSAATIKLPNLPFSTPATKWLRCKMMSGGITELEASGNCELVDGTFGIDIFTPVGSGTKDALTTAKTLKDLFHGKTFGVTSVNLVRVIPIGTETNWHHVQVNIDFHFQTNFTGV